MDVSAGMLVLVAFRGKGSGRRVSNRVFVGIDGARASSQRTTKRICHRAFLVRDGSMAGSRMGLLVETVGGDFCPDLPQLGVEFRCFQTQRFNFALEVRKRILMGVSHVGFLNRFIWSARDAHWVAQLLTNGLGE
jgi:hypothetical protein